MCIILSNVAPEELEHTCQPSLCCVQGQVYSFWKSHKQFPSPPPPLSLQVPPDSGSEYWDIWTASDHLGHHSLLLLLHLLRLIL